MSLADPIEVLMKKPAEKLSLSDEARVALELTKRHPRFLLENPMLAILGGPPVVILGTLAEVASSVVRKVF